MNSFMEDLVAYCESKKGAFKDYPFGPEPLVMKAGGKMFALINDQSISLKCDPRIAENLREQHSAIVPGYHLNKKHWNTIYRDGSLPAEELHSMIDHSYDLILASLTKAARQQLLENK